MLESHPFRWAYNVESLRHQLLLEIREPMPPADNNWRVTNESADLETALDLVRKNPEHKDIVHLGIRKAVRAAGTPTELLEVANKIRETLISNRQISQKGKRHYGMFLSAIVNMEMENQLREKMMSDYFVEIERKNNWEYTLATRDREELRNEQIQKYRGTTLGMIHDNGTLIMGGWAALKVAGATWVVIAGKATVATLAAVFGLPVVLTAGALILTGVAIRMYQQSNAEKPYQEQFTKRLVWEKPKIYNQELAKIISHNYQKGNPHGRNEN